MNSSEEFEELELRMAELFAESAEAAGLDQIVYLGGLGHESDRHSAHLASRHRVGSALAGGRTPVTEFRAAVIIGSGSASFEMLRSLVEVLPVMVVPRWVTKTRCQPIAIKGRSRPLGSCSRTRRCARSGPGDWRTRRSDLPADDGRICRCCRSPPPGDPPCTRLTPRLSSHWVNLVSPLPIRLARALIDSLTSDVVVGERTFARFDRYPSHGLHQAIERSVRRVRDLELPTRWTDASGVKPSTGAALPTPGDPSWSGGRVLDDTRTRRARADREDVMAVIRSGLGGKTDGLLSTDSGPFVASLTR
ncbi:MAG: hypothetical protein CM1200mP26_02770 [Acidimicrobiales bacterium]|nr:MAG: hypothetical protein CM1200mP26_02770 [Acidimicrobiales bacterium]